MRYRSSPVPDTWSKLTNSLTVLYDFRGHTITVADLLMCLISNVILLIRIENEEIIGKGLSIFALRLLRILLR